MLGCRSTCAPSTRWASGRRIWQRREKVWKRRRRKEEEGKKKKKKKKCRSHISLLLLPVQIHLLPRSLHRQTSHRIFLSLFNRLLFCRPLLLSCLSLSSRPQPSHPLRHRALRARRPRRSLHLRRRCHSSSRRPSPAPSLRRERERPAGSSPRRPALQLQCV